VSVGTNHACAIATDGTLDCFGDSSAGTVLDEPAGTYTAVAAGPAHACAIATDGTLECWGADGSGQVAEMPAGTYRAVSAGHDFVCAVGTDGIATCWGDVAGALTDDLPAEPVTTISAGFGHACAMVGTGGGRCWGSPADGQLGSAPSIGATAAPVGMVGRPYELDLGLTGDPRPRFTVTGGSLPAGLFAFSETSILGTPTTVTSPGTVEITATSLFGSDTVELTFAVDEPQPDGRIKRGTGTALLRGDGTYNTTGQDQTVTTSAARGSTVRFTISAQNDSDADDVLRLRGQRGTSRFTVRYERPNGSNITSAVRNGTFASPTALAPGATVTIVAEVTIGRGAPRGASVTRTVDVVSATDGDIVDRVRFTVRRR
jgi:hypothetical protein